MQEREAWLALNMVPHVGPANFALLLEHIGTAKRVLKAPLTALERIPSIGPATAKAIRSFPAEATVARERKRMAARGLRFLTLRDAGYPAPLREIHQPPPVLYIRGRWEELDRRAVAIVGSRDATPFGRGVADRLAFDLAARGLTIVSGLARSGRYRYSNGPIRHGCRHWGPRFDRMPHYRAQRPAIARRTRTPSRSSRRAPASGQRNRAGRRWGGNQNRGRPSAARFDRYRYSAA